MTEPPDDQDPSEAKRTAATRVLLSGPAGAKRVAPTAALRGAPPRPAGTAVACPISPGEVVELPLAKGTER